MEIHYFARRIDAEAFALFTANDTTYVSVERAGHQYAVIVEVRKFQVKSKNKAQVFVK